MEYINDPEWISYNVGNELMGFIGATIKRLINSDIGKAISQYGFVRMHPSAAAKMFASNRGHLIVTTRFDRADDSRRFFRFSYDMGNKLYAAYVHAMFSPEFVLDVFATSDPKEEKLGDAIELVLGLFDIWDSVPQCIPDNFDGPEIINEMRRGLENSLLYFCSVGSVKMGSLNRKANKRSRGIKEPIPSVIAGVQREINLYVPENETQNDFSPFSDILDDIQSEDEDDQTEEQKKEGMEEDDEHMVISSEDEEMAEDEEKEHKDDPMGMEEEEQPEAKGRRIAKMIPAQPRRVMFVWHAVSLTIQSINAQILKRGEKFRMLLIHSYPDSRSLRHHQKSGKHRREMNPRKRHQWETRQRG